MTETLERALAPLLIIGSFCNLCMIEYSREQLRAYLSYLHALVKWSSLIYVYYYPRYVRYSRENDMEIYIADIISLITITLILISFSRFKVQIFKCTPGSNIIILDFLVLLFFCLIVLLIKSIKNLQL
ncbi:hypothetical protein ALC56_15351 [Trachymyrmex septentrionalis]|uniref:Uncharacterized protein n=1 Tax=Trachymyrmex septentrionalis TaxID=34720 RepID=A0A151JST9_9HYME|nr:hypothetical protein ALC56_15351 [Trachymyrmex septentrionalis]